MLRRPLPLASLTVLAALGSLGLAGCGGDEPDQPASTNGSSVSPSAAPSVNADAVISEVTAVAPKLESAYRGTPYPQTLEEVIAGLPDTGVTLVDGITIGSYVYDPDATEFTLCLQDGDGAWASYDTAPMGVRDSGTSGGCP